MMWLWKDRPDPANMAAHAGAIFRFVLPSLPMFLVIPLRCGRGSVSGDHWRRAAP